MRDFRDAFESMALELMDHPDAEVLECEIGDSGHDADLDEAEQHLGMSLPAEVRALYLGMDGFSLRWVHRANPRRRHVARWDGEIAEPRKFHKEWNHLLDEQREDGRILLRSIHDTFVSDDAFADGDPELHLGHSHQGEVVVGDSTMSCDSYFRSLRVFDAYSAEGGAAFVVKAPAFLVAQGSNSGASYEDASLTDFESYLEFLVASRGLRSARYQFYMPWPGERRHYVGPTAWTPADFAGVFHAYEWREAEASVRPAWQRAAHDIADEARSLPCPECGTDLRYACDGQWIDGRQRRLWTWCGVCRRYLMTVLAAGRATGWPSATFNANHPSLGYWLDVANLAWARGFLPGHAAGPRGTG